MEKELSPIKERLFMLHEKGSFNSLTKEEQAFVLQHSSKLEFDQVRKLIVESKNAFTIPSPRPLQLPVKNNSLYRQILIPLSSAAAAAIITFIFFRQEKVVFQSAEKTVYKLADTVYITKHDVDTLIKEVRIKEKNRINTQVNSVITIELHPPSENAPITQNISLVDLQNQGQNASSDKTVELIEGIGF